MMKRSIFNDPQNLWGTWAKLAKVKQNFILILIGLCFLYLPLQQTLGRMQMLSLTETELLGQQDKLHHQQQILQALRQNFENTTLTPELAGRLAPITQLVQQLATRLQINNSQWIFERHPQLNLHIDGHFNDIKQFLTLLLEQSPQLKVIQLQINKFESSEEFSIQSEILLQLQPVKEKE